MAAKKISKAGDRAGDAARLVRENPYLQRLVEDASLRENIRTAYESGRTAYGRLNNGKGPTKALLEDKKLQKDLRNAANALKDASETLRAPKKRRRGHRARPARAGRGRHRRRRPERGSPLEGARRAVRRRGGVRLQLHHRAGHAGTRSGGDDHHDLSAAGGDAAGSR